MYDIVSSNKDSTNLTLKLSRVKSNESDTPGNLKNNNNQSSAVLLGSEYKLASHSSAFKHSVFSHSSE